MEYVDLHSHSTASDGTMPPAEVVRLAKRSGLAGLALTDHDTVAGVAEAADEARRVGIEFIAGIEISCIYPEPGTLHLLGYCVDPASPTLADLSRQLLDARDTRNPRIVAKLQELGVAISMEELESQAQGMAVGRPHIAAILVKKGYVKSIQQAFDKYLAPGGLAYFTKERLTPREAIERVVASGGLPVLAHPTQLKTQNDGELDRVVKDLIDMGLVGIEVIHSDHSPAEMDKYEKLADRYGLLKTGGSDFHGINKSEIALGVAAGRRIPRQYMDELLRRHAAKR